MKKLLLGGLAIVMLASSLFAFDGVLTVTNDTGYDIWYLYVSHESSNSWEEDVLGSEILFDGETIEITLEGYDTPIFDIRATDVDGDNYVVWEHNAQKRPELVITFDYFTVINEGDFSGYVDVTNDTGYDIWYLYVSHTDSDSWEEDVLGSEILYDGETFRVTVDGYPNGIFDIKAIDEDGDTYTRFSVDIEYEDVTLTLSDLD